jgi:hypothetical protein
MRWRPLSQPPLVGVSASIQLTQTEISNAVGFGFSIVLAAKLLNDEHHISYASVTILTNHLKILSEFNEVHYAP